MDCEQSREAKDFRVLVDEKLNVTQQRAFAAQKVAVSWASSKQARPTGLLW